MTDERNIPFTVGCEVILLYSGQINTVEAPDLVHAPTSSLPDDLLSRQNGAHDRYQPFCRVQPIRVWRKV